MIDQRLHSLEETQRMRQAGVLLECRVIFPSRVKVEQLGVANRPKRVNAQAARFLARWSEDVNQCIGDRLLIPGTRVKAGKEPVSKVAAIGFGPNGEKVVFESSKEGLDKGLMTEFTRRHVMETAGADAEMNTAQK